MNRRTAIRRTMVALGGVVSAPTLAGMLAGCSNPSPSGGYRPRVLSAEQLRVIRLIAEHIIPETDTPGATAAGVDRFVDMMLADFYPESARRQFLDELARVDDVARSSIGKPLERGTLDEQSRVLQILDAEAYPDPDMKPARVAEVQQRIARDDPPFFRTMKELTVSGYYTSEIGQTVELHLPPFGAYQADVPLDDIGRAWA